MCSTTRCCISINEEFEEVQEVQTAMLLGQVTTRIPKSILSIEEFGIKEYFKKMSRSEVK